MEQIPADLLRVYVARPQPRRGAAESARARTAAPSRSRSSTSRAMSSASGCASTSSPASTGRTLTVEDRLRLLERLTKVDAMERYQRAAFLGQKTFSIEGLDALVPMLETLMTMVADDGIGEVVMGMSHRGRLAVVAHVANHSYKSILNAFELASARAAIGGFDINRRREVPHRRNRDVSHRNRQGDSRSTAARTPATWRRSTQSWRDGAAPRRPSAARRRCISIPMAALPVLIHGDAAFAGQGVVQEVLNLQSLPGYTTGGTVHFIADNQVGFTTDPQEGRSTRYASDLAKGFDIPIVHVNADDVEACLAAITFAYDYRRAYRRDVMVHLIGYRRFGHNEADEPAYTQPLMYMKIRAASNRPRDRSPRKLVDRRSDQAGGGRRAGQGDVQPHRRRAQAGQGESRRRARRSHPRAGDRRAGRRDHAAYRRFGSPACRAQRAAAHVSRSTSHRTPSSSARWSGASRRSSRARSTGARPKHSPSHR